MKALVLYALEDYFYDHIYATDTRFELKVMLSEYRYSVLYYRYRHSLPVFEADLPQYKMPFKINKHDFQMISWGK